MSRYRLRLNLDYIRKSLKNLKNPLWSTSSNFRYLGNVVDIHILRILLPDGGESAPKSTTPTGLSIESAKHLYEWAFSISKRRDAQIFIGLCVFRRRARSSKSQIEVEEEKSKKTEGEIWWPDFCLEIAYLYVCPSHISDLNLQKKVEIFDWNRWFLYSFPLRETIHTYSSEQKY